MPRIRGRHSVKSLLIAIAILATILSAMKALNDPLVWFSWRSGLSRSSGIHLLATASDGSREFVIIMDVESITWKEWMSKYDDRGSKIWRTGSPDSWVLAQSPVARRLFEQFPIEPKSIPGVVYSSRDFMATRVAEIF
jgi:hypothetical protein